MRSKNAISRGFILPNGDVARHGTQHDDIAMNYICDNKMLEDYDKSRLDPCDYLVLKLYAIKVGCNMGTNPKVITYVEECMNNAQWTYIEYYHRNGYKLDPVKETAG